jgi:hypothetical protein
MVSLPPLPKRLIDAPSIRGGYDICVEIEKDILESRLILQSSPLSPLICVRTLGFLIIHAPDDIGRANIGREIVSCKSKGSVVDLGAFFCDHFIRCCKQPVHRC